MIANLPYSNYILSFMVIFLYHRGHSGDNQLMVFETKLKSTFFDRRTVSAKIISDLDCDRNMFQQVFYLFSQNFLFLRQ